MFLCAIGGRQEPKKLAKTICGLECRSELLSLATASSIAVEIKRLMVTSLAVLTFPLVPVFKVQQRMCYPLIPMIQVQPSSEEETA